MISIRIKARRRELKLTQEELGARVGVTKATISFWERGDTKPSGENLVALAKSMACSPDWILSGKEAEAVTKVKVRPCPVFNNGRDAVDWVRSRRSSSNNRSESSIMFCPITTASERTFAYQITGESMLNREAAHSFKSGDFVFIDPEKEPTNGNTVLVKANERDDVFIRSLSVDGDKMYLVAINPSWPNRIVELANTTDILGVVICKLETVD